MISVGERKKECCGCSACSQICPQECIKMEQDSEGFLYPIIDVKKCISCNRCNHVCPVENAGRQPFEEEGKSNPLAYGGWHKDDKVRYDSSSGGAFTLLAEYVISQGGVVYGCTLDENMKAIHIGVESKDELHILRGSKYVQSEIGDVYSKVKGDILSERKVLFVGTPCQAAGLYSFLGRKKYQNLYIVDFICHGVPSPKIFKEYIKQIEKNNGGKVVSFKFRNKDQGWNQSGVQLGTKATLDNDTIIRKYPAFKDSFMNGFLDDVCLRPSCYDWRFKSMPKVYVDFTIADFWGVNNISKSLNDQKGTSLILVHSLQGSNLWNKVKDKCYYEEVPFGKAIRRNKSLIQSVEENPNRMQFYQDFEKRGYLYVEKKYMSAFTWAFHKMIKIGMNFIKHK